MSRISLILHEAEAEAKPRPSVNIKEGYPTNAGGIQPSSILQRHYAFDVYQHFMA